jgi:tetratricopeptide (TPR) repeat protein
MHQNYSVAKTRKSVEELLSMHMYALASESLENGIQKNPNSTELRILQAKVASDSRDFYTATELYETLLKGNPNNPQLLIDSAIAWSRLGELEKAVQLSKRAIELSNESIRSVLTLADIYERNNLSDEAELLISEISQSVQDNGNYQRLKARILLSKKEYATAIDYIQALLNAGQDNIRTTKLCFLLSKAYDKIGEYDKAWEAATQAHEYDDTPFDEQTFFSQFDQMRSCMTKEFREVLVEGPPTCVEPLFIVANPRSGTSLLEQIIGMHTDVENGGEMPSGSLLQGDVATLTDSFHSWPMNLIDLKETDVKELSNRYCGHCDFFRGDAKIVSNKALNLHLQLGFLSKILPNSRAILLHRHPLDNAVSCYTTNLLAAGLPYTNSLETIGKTWIARKKLTELWIDILSIPLVELHYENLVSNQREETERIIAFLGLPWQEDCMEFHTSKRVARTISYDQVNKKMYNTSNGRWKNYEKHLGPLIDVVSDYI